MASRPASRVTAPQDRERCGSFLLLCYSLFSGFGSGFRPRSGIGVVCGVAIDGSCGGQGERRVYRRWLKCAFLIP
jgi:hypothetical protein